MRRFKGFLTEVRALRFSADGRRLLARSYLGSVRSYELPSGQSRSLLANPGTWVQDMAGTADGRAVVVGNAWGRPLLWYGAADGFLPDHSGELPVGGGMAYGMLRASPDGGSVLMVSPSNHVLVWDLARQEARWEIDLPAERPDTYWFTRDAVFTPDGGTIALRFAEHQLIRLRSADGAVETCRWKGDRNLVAWVPAPGGEWLAGANPSTVPFLDNALAHRPFKLPEPTGLAIRGFAWSPDGKLLAAADTSGNIALWDVRLPPPGSDSEAQPEVERRAVFDWQMGGAAVLAFSPDGLTLAAGAPEGQLILWDVE